MKVLRTGPAAAGILLAAGESRRMGRVKALLPHPDGSERPLVLAAAETLLAAGLSPLFIVLGHARNRIAARFVELESPIRFVLNPAYRSGMLSSLQTGVRAAGADPATSWVVVAPVDQPFMTVALIRRLLAATAAAGTSLPAAVVPATPAMEEEGRWGLPVALHRRLFPDLLTLAPKPGARDHGARALLARHRRELRIVPAITRELQDLDNPEDYRNSTTRNQARS